MDTAGDGSTNVIGHGAGSTDVFEVSGAGSTNVIGSGAGSTDIPEVRGAGSTNVIGRGAGSTNVPAGDLCDMETLYLSPGRTLAFTRT